MDGANDDCCHLWDDGECDQRELDFEMRYIGCPGVCTGKLDCARFKTELQKTEEIYEREMFEMECERLYYRGD